MFTGVKLADNTTNCNLTESTGDAEQSGAVEKTQIYTYGKFSF